MTAINPRRIRGAWADGYVLDLHSTGSTFLGYDEFGHPVFETTRTEIGELLYRLKYKGDASALAEIGTIAGAFILSRDWRVDVVVPVSPTRPRRVEPVYRIAAELGERLRQPVETTAVRKKADAPELKNLHEYEDRLDALENAFAVRRGPIAARSVLMVDDLMRSGATMNAVAAALMEAGAARVFAFALTRTRRV